MGWIIYAIAILVVSGLVGLHLGRFREAYTEMTGMMAGMTMGMLNGFVLGYAAAAASETMFGTVATGSLFWGNLVGIMLGVLLGGYFGRAGGLMGVMDGAMGGVMGGSMGAMLAAMLTFPPALLFWTGVLLSAVYVVGMAALVVLIERSAPGHEALHWLAPYFTRAVADEIEEEAGDLEPQVSSPGRLALTDYYAYLGITREATEDQVAAAYLAKLAVSNDDEVQRADQAVAILTDPGRRKAYDARLIQSQAATQRGDCCPPPRKKAAAAAGSTTSPMAAAVTPARTTHQATVPVRAQQTSPRQSRNGTAKAGRPAEAHPARRSHNRAQPARKHGLGAGPIIGATLGALLVLALFFGWQMSQGSGGGLNAYTDNGRQLPADFVAQLQAQAVPARDEGGKQTLDFAVNGDSMSYSPKVISVKKGTPVHFDVSVQGRDPGCGRFIGIRGLGAHGIANPGQVTSLDFTPSETGVFQINCNMQMMDPGYLIVTQ
jgi:plastocyanin